MVRGSAKMQTTLPRASAQKALDELRAQADYYEQSVRIEAISDAKENAKSLSNQRDASVAEHEAKEQLLAQQPGVLAKANALAGRGE